MMFLSELEAGCRFCAYLSTILSEHANSVGVKIAARYIHVIGLVPKVQPDMVVVKQTVADAVDLQQPRQKPQSLTKY